VGLRNRPPGYFPGHPVCVEQAGRWDAQGTEVPDSESRQVAKVKSKPKYRMISWVAERYSVHPQTLRLWEREGLLCPARSSGNTRLYDEESCQRLETILALTRDLGVNLAGVEIILNLRDQIERFQEENGRLREILQHQINERNRIPRYHALVQVEGRSLQIVDEE